MYACLVCFCIQRQRTLRSDKWTNEPCTARFDSVIEIDNTKKILRKKKYLKYLLKMKQIRKQTKAYSNAMERMEYIIFCGKNVRLFTSHLSKVGPKRWNSLWRSLITLRKIFLALQSLSLVIGLLEYRNNKRDENSSRMKRKHATREYSNRIPAPQMMAT